MGLWSGLESLLFTEALGSPSTPKLHGIVLMTLFDHFFSDGLKSMFSVKACFKHTWRLSLTAEGKGGQDLVWLQPGAPGKAHVMPDTGVKSTPAFKRGGDIQSSRLQHKKMQRSARTWVPCGCKTLQDDCWRTIVAAYSTGTPTRVLMHIRNHKSPDYLSGKQNMHILVT